MRPHPDGRPVDRAPYRMRGPTMGQHRILLGIGPRADLRRPRVLSVREVAATASRAVDFNGIAPRSPADPCPHG